MDDKTYKDTLDNKLNDFSDNVQKVIENNTKTQNTYESKTPSKSINFVPFIVISIIIVVIFFFQKEEAK